MNDENELQNEIIATEGLSKANCEIKQLFTWTRFFDMNSGGGCKLGTDIIWIEANEEKAIELFERIFGRDPNNVTCSCCGSDYYVYESDFKPKDGDFIVSKSDIEKFECGNKLDYLRV